MIIKIEIIHNIVDGNTRFETSGTIPNPGLLYYIFNKCAGLVFDNKEQMINAINEKMISTTAVVAEENMKVENDGKVIRVEFGKSGKGG